METALRQQESKIQHLEKVNEDMKKVIHTMIHLHCRLPKIRGRIFLARSGAKVAKLPILAKNFAQNEQFLRFWPSPGSLGGGATP